MDENSLCLHKDAHRTNKETKSKYQKNGSDRVGISLPPQDFAHFFPSAPSPAQSDSDSSLTVSLSSKFQHASIFLASCYDPIPAPYFTPDELQKGLNCVTHKTSANVQRAQPPLPPASSEPLHIPPSEAQISWFSTLMWALTPGAWIIDCYPSTTPIPNKTADLSHPPQLSTYSSLEGVFGE